MVSLANPPAILLASVPEMLPAASTVRVPTAPPGTAPVERRSVPVRLNPHFPATPALEQPGPSCARATGAPPKAIVASKSGARKFNTYLEFINFLLPIFHWPAAFAKEGSSAVAVHFSLCLLSSQPPRHLFSLTQMYPVKEF